MTINKENCTWHLGGIVGNRTIHLADNRDLTLLEMMLEYNLGRENFCFSLDSKIILKKQVSYELF